MKQLVVGVLAALLLHLWCLRTICMIHQQMKGQALQEVLRSVLATIRYTW